MIDFFTQLASRGIEVRQSSTDDNEYRINCLFCLKQGAGARDFKFRLGFNTDSGLGHCFKCGWSSRKALLEILRALGETDLSDIQATRFTSKTRERPEVVELPEGFVSLAGVDEDDPLIGRAKRYVRKRGVTEKQIKLHNVGTSIDDPAFGYRVIFPVMQGKKILGFVGRDFTDSQVPPYKNSTGEKVAFNIRPKRYERGTEVIVVAEGIIKAFAIERALSYKVCCSALLGNSITALQANQLTQFKEVILFQDPDPQGMAGFLGVADRLQPLVKKVSLVWPWPKKQADELTPEEIRQAIDGRRESNLLLRLRIRREMRNR